MSKARVCQTCGDLGYKELLVCCSKCQISEEHLYCLAVIPNPDDNITYICAQCVISEQTYFKQTPDYRSEPSQLSIDTFRRHDGPSAVIQNEKKSGTNCISSVSERPVEVETCFIPASLETVVPKPSLNVVLPEAGLNENDRSHQFTDGHQETKRERHNYLSEPSELSINTFQINDGPSAVIQNGKKSGAKCISSVSERVVAVETCDIPASLETVVPKPSLKIVLPEAGLNENDRSHQNTDGHQETKRKRQKFSHGACEKSDGVEDQRIQAVPVAPVEPIATCDPLNVSSHYPVHDDPEYLYAQPIIDPAWRGCFDISGRRFSGLVAHLSSKACLKVVEAAGMMPAALYIRKMARSEAWPKSFVASAPTDENIGLYIFPGSESVVKPFDELIHDIIRRDFVLKVLFENVELLIFPSNQLPPPYWRFNGKHYLWGVFRERKESHSHESGNYPVPALASKDSNSFRRSPCSPLSMKSGSMSDSPRSPLSLNSRVFASEKRIVNSRARN